MLNPQCLLCLVPRSLLCERTMIVWSGLEEGFTYGFNKRPFSVLEAIFWYCDERPNIAKGAMDPRVECLCQSNYRSKSGTAKFWVWSNYKLWPNCEKLLSRGYHAFSCQKRLPQHQYEQQPKSHQSSL